MRLEYSCLLNDNSIKYTFSQVSPNDIDYGFGNDNLKHTPWV